jgi:hypothetical protein
MLKVGGWFKSHTPTHTKSLNALDELAQSECAQSMEGADTDKIYSTGCYELYEKPVFSIMQDDADVTRTQLLLLS